MNPTDIHVGKLVEERIEEIGMSKAEFGRRINTSRQNVNTLLRKRIWGVQQIVSASKILNKNFLEPFLEAIGNGSRNSSREIYVKEKGMRVMIEVDRPDQLQDLLAWWENKEQERM